MAKAEMLELIPLPGTVPGTARVDSKQLRDLNKFAHDVLKENIVNVESSGRYMRQSRTALFGMYIALFVVGLLTAVASIIKGELATSTGEAVGAVAIAGLSAASFFGLFISRPLESLERNTIYASWLTAVMNTYWTRLMYFSDAKGIDKELQDATKDLVRDLMALADKHAAAIGKYPALAEASARTTTGGTAEPRDSKDGQEGGKDAANGQPENQ